MQFMSDPRRVAPASILFHTWESRRQ